MKKLIIHAGSHKTGSTSIQKSLKSSCDKLAERNIALFSVNPDGSENIHGHSNHWVRHYGKGKDFDAEVNSKLRGELASLDADVVIFSAEHLFWLNSRLNIESFYDLISDQFDDIRVIFYLRRQDQLLLSHHQEGSKHYRWCEHLYYGSEPKAFPSADFPEYLDYFSKLRKWSDVFGRKSIDVRVFEKSELYRGDVVSDFCFLLDKDLRIKSLRVNESRSKHQVIVGHMLNSIGVSHLDKSRVKLLSSIDSDQKLLPSRGQARELYNKYKLSNKYLNDFFKVSSNPYLFGEDFSFYPEEEDASCFDTLKAVLQSKYFFGGAVESDIFSLRDNSVELVHHKPGITYRLACKLIKIVHFLEAKWQRHK